MAPFRKTRLAAAVATLGAAMTGSMHINALELEEVVVTATYKPGATTMESSISVTSLTTESIEAFTPRSEAEVLLMIPGIRAENTGGAGGNSNITVRGLPIASGGSKYVQLQEDGMPVVEFGDMAFANNDYWVRYDSTVERVQATRGGSASVSASHAPGAVINYISKTGEEEGGSLGLTKGLDYDDTRLDFEYGTPITDTLRFHVGGYWRSGEGPREVSWNAQEGHQIKLNITKDFEDQSGHVRFYFKNLEETAPTYLDYPMSASVSGNKLSNFGTVTNFDARSGTTLSKNIRNVAVVRPDGSFDQVGVNGIESDVSGWGIEFVKELNENWTFEERYRNNDTSGAFTTHWSNPDSMDPTDFGAASAVYFNGPLAGQAATSASSIANGGTGYFTRAALAHVDINDVGNYANDISLTGSFELDGGNTFTVKGGNYRSGQTINMDWMISEVVYELSSNDPALIDLFDASGNALTTAGMTGYNNQWGGCCGRSYDEKFTTDAYYLSGTYETEKLTLDAGVRRENYTCEGTYTSSTAVPGGLDLNGDGVITGAENNVNLIDPTTTRPIDIELDYTSWSFGANFMVNEDIAVFGRLSRGHRAGADRIAENTNIVNNLTGELNGSAAERAALNQVDQFEFGVKYAGDDLQAFVTYFQSEVTEYSTDINAVTGYFTTQQDYETSGLEIETTYNVTENFYLDVNLTYTDAEISGSTSNPAVAGNTPLATPDFMYLISPTYSFEKGAVGMSLRGTTDWYANDSNSVKLEGDRFVNLFARYDVMENLQVSLNVNNLLDDFGTAGRMNGFGEVVSTRPQLGRTMSATVKYTF